MAGRGKRSFATGRVLVLNLTSGRNIRSKGKTKIYVDSGATVTIIPERLLPALEGTGPLEKSAAHFETANGIKEATAIHNVSVCLEKVCYKGDILVTGDIPGDLLIGTDFLSAKKCKIDFEAKTMKCGSKDIPFNLE
jgi:hypothetical protein